MEWLGDLERAFAASIYPNRVLIAIAAAAIGALLAALAWRGRWDRVVRRHPRASAAGLVVGLAFAVPSAWYVGSPLLLSSSIDEPAPIAATVASPPHALSPAPTISPPVGGSVTPTPAGPTAAPIAAPERSGAFTGADEFHFARGGARLVETAPGEFTVRLEDFAVRNGPDLFVYLSPSADGFAKDAVELGRLKADRGNQNYPVPRGIEVGAVRSVVIWCKQFGVLFGTARLAGS